MLPQAETTPVTTLASLISKRDGPELSRQDMCRRTGFDTNLISLLQRRSFGRMLQVAAATLYVLPPYTA